MEKNLIQFNTVALLALLINELRTSLDRHVDIQKASIAILGIAATQYAISGYLYSDHPKIAEDIRYIDWLFTTPLLLFTYWKLANVHGYQSDFSFLGVAVVSMVILGYMAEKQTSNYFVLSLVPYLYILYEIRKIQQMFREKGLDKHSQLGNFFIFGWAVYPLAFYAPNSRKYVLYSIGDFVNKGVYSIMLYNVLNVEEEKLYSHLRKAF